MSILLQHRLLASCIIGTSLILTGCSTTKTAQPNKTSQKKHQGNIPTYYTVRSGDTLSKIAYYYGLDYRQLGALNGLDSNYTIRVGQRLRLTQPKGVKSNYQQPVSSQIVRPTTPVYTQPVNRPITTTTPNRVTPPPVHTQPILTNAPSYTNHNKWLPPVRGNLLRGFDEMLGNRGVWFSAVQGSPVTATKDGTVMYVGTGLPEYGNLIMIQHPDEYISVYGHLGSFNIGEKQPVKAGQQIGTVGFVRLVNQPAMEFQIRYQGQPINPINMLK